MRGRKRARANETHIKRQESLDGNVKNVLKNEEITFKIVTCHTFTEN